MKGRVFTRHSLALTLFFGPLGILSHLATRQAVAAYREEEVGDVLLEGAGEIES